MPDSREEQVVTRRGRIEYQRRRLTVRHPLTGERLWRIRLKMWSWETFRV